MHPSFFLFFLKELNVAYGTTGCCVRYTLILYDTWKRFLYIFPIAQSIIFRMFMIFI